MKFSEDYIKLHWIIFLNSFIPSVLIFISMSPLEILFFRTMAAAALIRLYIAHQKMEMPTGWRDRLALLAPGCLLFLFWGLTIISAKISNASVYLVGTATSSLWVTFFQIFALRERSKPFQVLMGMNAVTAIYIIYNSDFKYGLGLAASIIGACFSALLTIVNSKMAQKYNFTVITYYQMLGAFISSCFLIPFYQDLGGAPFNWLPDIKDYLIVLGLAFFFSIYAYSQYIKIMKTISPFIVALVTNLSPVYGILIAIIINGKREYMNTGFYVGTVMLLMSVFAYPLLIEYMKNYQKMMEEHDNKSPEG